MSLPADTRLFMCHDYKAPGRDHFAWETTVAERAPRNPHIRDGVSEDEFVAMREERDKGLSTPRLLIPSIQVNIRAGRLPPADERSSLFAHSGKASRRATRKRPLLDAAADRRD